jgi:hypothetical protein
VSESRRVCRVRACLTADHIDSVRRKADIEG